MTNTPCDISSFIYDGSIRIADKHTWGTPSKFGPPSVEQIIKSDTCVITSCRFQQLSRYFLDKEIARNPPRAAPAVLFQCIKNDSSLVALREWQPSLVSKFVISKPHVTIEVAPSKLELLLPETLHRDQTDCFSMLQAMSLLCSFLTAEENKVTSYFSRERMDLNSRIVNTEGFQMIECLQSFNWGADSSFPSCVRHLSITVDEAESAVNFSDQLFHIGSFQNVRCFKLRGTRDKMDPLILATLMEALKSLNSLEELILESVEVESSFRPSFNGLITLRLQNVYFREIDLCNLSNLVVLEVREPEFYYSWTRRFYDIPHAKILNIGSKIQQMDIYGEYDFRLTQHFLALHPQLSALGISQALIACDMSPCSGIRSFTLQFNSKGRKDYSNEEHLIYWYIPLGIRSLTLCGFKGHKGQEVNLSRFHNLGGLYVYRSILWTSGLNLGWITELSITDSNWHGQLYIPQRLITLKVHCIDSSFKFYSNFYTRKYGGQLDNLLLWNCDFSNIDTSFTKSDMNAVVLLGCGDRNKILYKTASESDIGVSHSDYHIDGSPARDTVAIRKVDKGSTSRKNYLTYDPDGGTTNKHKKSLPFIAKLAVPKYMNCPTI